MTKSELIDLAQVVQDHNPEIQCSFIEYNNESPVNYELKIQWPDGTHRWAMDRPEEWAHVQKFV